MKIDHRCKCALGSINMELISVKDYDQNKDVIDIELSNPKFAKVSSNHPAGYAPTYEFIPVEGSKEKMRIRIVQLLLVGPFTFDTVVQVFGFQREWWNARHAGFKSRCPGGVRVGIPLPVPVMKKPDRVIWFPPKEEEDEGYQCVILEWHDGENYYEIEVDFQEESVHWMGRVDGEFEHEDYNKPLQYNGIILHL